MTYTLNTAVATLCSMHENQHNCCTLSYCCDSATAVSLTVYSSVFIFVASESLVLLAQLTVNSAFDQASILRDLPPHLSHPAAGNGHVQLLAHVIALTCSTQRSHAQ
jgi:hypothetical protein